MSSCSKVETGRGDDGGGHGGRCCRGFAVRVRRQNRGAQALRFQQKNFWLHPPDDWFMGDETKEQKGTHVLNTLPPPTGFTKDEIEATLKNVKLPPGFKIELWARGLPGARQMAWGDNGTLYRRLVLEHRQRLRRRGRGRQEDGQDHPQGHEDAHRDRLPGRCALRCRHRQDLQVQQADGVLDNMPKPEVVYDDMPPYIPHGWKYLTFDKNGWLYVAFGPPCNICLPPTSTAQIRHIDPATGLAEIVALGVRNSVGGDVDPRSGDYWFTENARDWLGDDIPSDKLNHITKIGENFGYPHCHQGDIPDPKFAMGHKCSEFAPPALKLGAHVAPLGMKFYTGNQFPADYKDSMIIAEHGSWNRHKFQGGRLMRVTADPDGKNIKEHEFASGWIGADGKYRGRPNDVLQAKDGSLMVADDFTGSIYRISYSK